jgi:hypothetical protein
MANHPPPDGNVVPFPRTRHAGQADVKRRDLPLGPALQPTIDRLREIAAVSGDHLATEGPVHPDHRLLDLCAAALDLIQQADQAAAVYQGKFRAGHEWTDADRVHGDAARDRRHGLTVAAAQILKQARRHKATTPAGVFAKALLVRSSVTGATLLAMTLADDLISCDGLRHSLTWSDGPRRP